MGEVRSEILSMLVKKISPGFQGYATFAASGTLMRLKPSRHLIFLSLAMSFSFHHSGFDRFFRNLGVMVPAVEELLIEERGRESNVSYGFAESLSGWANFDDSPTVKFPNLKRLELAFAEWAWATFYSAVITTKMALPRLTDLAIREVPASPHILHDFVQSIDAPSLTSLEITYRPPVIGWQIEYGQHIRTFILMADLWGFHQIRVLRLRPFACVDAFLAVIESLERLEHLTYEDFRAQHPEKILLVLDARDRICRKLCTLDIHNVTTASVAVLQRLALVRCLRTIDVTVVWRADELAPAPPVFPERTNLRWHAVREDELEALGLFESFSHDWQCTCENM